MCSYGGVYGDEFGVGYRHLGASERIGVFGRFDLAALVQPHLKLLFVLFVCV